MPVSATSRKIMLTDDFRYEEPLASAAIYPGMIGQLDSDGKVLPNNGAGLACLMLIPIEDSLVGDLISTVYAIGDMVRYVLPRKGERCLLRLADGETAVKGSKLVSNGDGTVKVMSADSSAAVIEETLLAIADEAVDMSDSSGADPVAFIKSIIV